MDEPANVTGTNGPVLNPGNLPIIRTGAWHTLPPYGSAGSANVPNGRLFALPFWPGRRCLMTGLAANVTLALLGGSIRFGLYKAANGLPLTLLNDFGTVTVGVTGIRSVTANFPVTPLLYFVVIARQGAGLNLGLSSRDTWEPIVSDTSPTLASNLNTYYVDGITGALPDMFGVPLGAVQGPSVSLQLV